MAHFLKDGRISEKSIQQMVVKYLHAIGYGKSVIQIYNEGAGRANRGADARRTGLRPGASDLFIAEPRHNRHGLWLELKTIGGKLTNKQAEFMADMESRRYYAATAFTFDEAKELLDWYLDIGANAKQQQL